MSSNLKVNTILPSSGNTVSIAGIASVTSSVSIASSCTATTFYGNGANLTGTQTTINNNANNQVITATGTANTLQGEGNLKFDGTNLGVGVDPNGVASYSTIHLKGQTSGNGGAIRLTDHGDTPDSDDFTIYKNSAAGYLRINGTDPLIAYMNGADRVRIDSSGRVMIGTDTEGTGSGDELTVSASGNMGLTLRSTSSNYCNIYFSDATSGTAEYEGYMSYNHATDSLEFATGHTERLRITSTGKFGLNRNAPQYAMHLSPAVGETRIDLHMTNSTTGHNNNDGVQFGYQNTQGAYIWNFENTNIYFGTNNLERLRITSGGQVGLGRDTSGNINTRAVLELAAPFDDVSDNDGSADQGTNNHDAILLNIAGPAAASGKNIGSIAWDKGGRRRAAIMGEYQSTDNDYLALAFFTRGTDGTGDFYKSYIINHNGSASLHGSLSQNTSDDRLKKDKVEIENALDKVNSLSSFTHKWNEIAVRAGLEENKTEIGLSAQEVQGLYPSLVDVNNTMIDPDNPTTEYLTIHYEKVVPLLVASIKELTSEINSLKSRLSSLEGS